MTWELLPEPGDHHSGGNVPPHQQGARSPRQCAPASPRWVLTIVGVLVSLLGLALLAWPFYAASHILAFLVGSAFIGNGIAALVGARSRGLGVPAGIFFIVVGLIAILLPDFTVTLLVSFVALAMLGIGGIWLLFALRFRGQVSPIFIVVPAVVFALGLAGFIWPSFALTVAALAAGLVTLAVGSTLVWFSLALRSRRE